MIRSRVINILLCIYIYQQNRGTSPPSKKLGPGVWSLGLGIWSLGSGIWDQGYGICCLRSAIWDLWCGI